MKVIVIGGAGHVGQFMVPKLLEAGMEIVVVGSGSTPMPKGGVWEKVQYLACDVGNSQELKKLSHQQPEVVIDMTGGIWNIYHELKTITKHFIACGSLWMYGEPKVVPTPESTQNDCIVSEGYKKRYSEILELIEISKNDGVGFTAIMPPNICGPGKIPIDCLGGRDIEVHKDHKNGKEVVLPEGPEALLSPCDAEDIAACFVGAVCNRDKASGQIFNVGSEYAITATELVNVFSVKYDIEIPIRYCGWQEYISSISPGIGWWWHFKAHMCPDISKSQKLLGYHPQYTPEQSLCRAIDWMLENYDL
jgi:nucleoside-diphosphate-sugar epimerase